MEGDDGSGRVRDRDGEFPAVMFLWYRYQALAAMVSAAVNNLLLEEGSNLLLEDGGLVVLE